ncbi:hypothetical protein CRG98_000425, partial [Punica granatum]
MGHTLHIAPHPLSRWVGPIKVWTSPKARPENLSEPGISRFSSVKLSRAELCRAAALFPSKLEFELEAFVSEAPPTLAASLADVFLTRRCLPLLSWRAIPRYASNWVCSSLSKFATFSLFVVIALRATREGDEVCSMRPAEIGSVEADDKKKKRIKKKKKVKMMLEETSEPEDSTELDDTASPEGTYLKAGGEREQSIKKRNKKSLKGNEEPDLDEFVHKAE